MADFYADLAEILSEESVNREDELNSFDEWDSLAVLSVIAMLDENYGIKVESRDIKALKTAGDIEDLIMEKMVSN